MTGHDDEEALLARGAARVRDEDPVFAEAAEWAHARAARRWRGVRGWVGAGVLGGLLLSGGAVATALVAAPRPEPPATAVESVEFDYITSSGAVCAVVVQARLLGVADPEARRRALAELRTAELSGLGSRAADPEAEVASMVADLREEFEQSLRRRGLPIAQVVLVHRADCAPAPTAPEAAPPTTGEDFGRELSDWGGRPADAAGFLRISTGDVCEIHIQVDLDWQRDDAHTQEARAYLEEVRRFFRTLDFASVDYSALLEDPGFLAFSDPARPWDREWIAWMRTASALAPAPSGYDGITIGAEARCGPELDG